MYTQTSCTRSAWGMYMRDILRNRITLRSLWNTTTVPYSAVPALLARSLALPALPASPSPGSLEGAVEIAHPPRLCFSRCPLPRFEAVSKLVTVADPRVTGRSTSPFLLPPGNPPRLRECVRRWTTTGRMEKGTYFLYCSSACCVHERLLGDRAGPVITLTGGERGYRLTRLTSGVRAVSLPSVTGVRVVSLPSITGVSRSTSRVALPSFFRST